MKYTYYHCSWVWRRKGSFDGYYFIRNPDIQRLYNSGWLLKWQLLWTTRVSCCQRSCRAGAGTSCKMFWNKKLQNGETFCLSSNFLQLKRFFFIKVNIQLLFIADLRQRRVHEDSPQHKPGRQIVTFLLISNLGLWITYNFEIQKVIFSSFTYLSITIMIIGYILWGWAILYILGKRYTWSKWILWLFSMGGNTTDDFASLCFLSVPFNGCSSWALEKLLPNKKTFECRGLNTRKLYLFISRKYFIGYSTVLHNFLSENRSLADLSLHRK